MTHNFANTWLEATLFTYLALAVKSIDLDLALTLVSMISSMVMIRLFFVTFFYNFCCNELLLFSSVFNVQCVCDVICATALYTG